MNCCAKKNVRGRIKRCNKPCKFIFCKEHWKKNKKIALFWFGLVGGAFAIIGYWDTITGWTKTKHDKFIEENFIPGIIVPFKPYDNIYINSGGTSFEQQMPEDGLYQKSKSLQAVLRKGGILIGVLLIVYMLITTFFISH